MWPLLLLFSIGVLISALGFLMPLTGASAGLPLLINLIEEQSLKPRRLADFIDDRLNAWVSSNIEYWFYLPFFDSRVNPPRYTS